jgi:hypothetical protein
MKSRIASIPVSTTTAFLTSAGYNHRKATLHKYSHSELLKLPGEGKSYITGLAHMFRCAETGELRRWGFDVTFGKDDGSN